MAYRQPRTFSHRRFMHSSSGLAFRSRTCRNQVVLSKQRPVNLMPFHTTFSSTTRASVNSSTALTGQTKTLSTGEDEASYQVDLQSGNPKCFVHIHPSFTFLEQNTQFFIKGNNSNQTSLKGITNTSRLDKCPKAYFHFLRPPCSLR
jgi:hypothetical protein